MFKWIRIPKGLALASFLFPWLTVSCAGQPLVKATGFGLAFGSFDVTGIDRARVEQLASPNLLLIVAILTIAAGLFFAIRKPAKAAALTLCTSVASLAFIGLSMLRYSKSYVGTALGTEAESIADARTVQMIQVHYELGFWIAILLLVVAAILSFIVMREDRGSSTETAPSTPPR